MLDVGSGSGSFLREVEKTFIYAETRGLEIHEDLIQLTNNKAKEIRI